MAKLYFRYGAMGASKTANALMVKYNYEEKDLSPLLLQPKQADRDGERIVKSRIGLSFPCVYAEEFLDSSIDMDLVFSPDWSFEKADDTALAQHKFSQVLDKAEDYNAIIVDESQFLTKSEVMQLRSIVDKLHIPVICYGLATDFKQNFFEGSEALMNFADVKEEIKTICWCGEGAKCNARLDEYGKVVRQGEQIVVGGTENNNDLPKYTSLCRKHYDEGNIGVKMMKRFSDYYEKMDVVKERLEIISNFVSEGLDSIKKLPSKSEDIYEITWKGQYSETITMYGLLEKEEPPYTEKPEYTFYYGVTSIASTLKQNEWYDISEDIIDSWTKETTEAVMYGRNIDLEKEKDNYERD